MEISKGTEDQAFEKLITQVTKESSKEWVEGSFKIQDKGASPGTQNSNTNKLVEKSMCTLLKNGEPVEVSSNIGANSSISGDRANVQETGLKEQQIDTCAEKSDEAIREKEAETQLKEAPELIDETEGEIQHRKKTEEDEYMDYNIQQSWGFIFKVHK
ncbi:hypothetical protein KY285_035858 [Solanum tuberosum]|nr:hypothetical protein KY289_036031 [Solanum tuberosum]KAH0639272.1 hypothetical protein KY285_035858 [Solanum tuberosum]